MYAFSLAAVLLTAAGQADMSTPAVMKEIRRIEAASLKGATDPLRIEFTRKAQERPADPMPRIFLAWLALPSDDAWNQLKAVATMHPENPWVHYGMGRIYAKWKMRDQARTEIDLVLKRDPKFFPAITVLGDLALAADDGPKAEAEYRRALAIEDDPFARTGLGLALLKQGKKAEGLDALQASIRAYPEQPAALSASIPLLVESKAPGALEAAQAAADLRPKDPDARRVLAQLRFEAGDKSGAAKEYDRLVILGNPTPETLERLAGLYRELDAGVDEERVVAAQAAVQPQDAALCVRLFELKAARKDLPGAEKALVDALERDPKLRSARLFLGKLKSDQGLAYRALEQYRLILESAPDDAEAKALVSKLEADFRLPKRALKGPVNGVYWSITSALNKLYAERRAARPDLAGKLKVRLQVGPKGTVTNLELIEDTVNDPILAGHVYFSLKDAEYKEKKVEPVIEFELGKKK